MVRLSEDDRHWLDVAIAEARKGREEGGVPIGAALVAEGQLLGAGHNRRSASLEGWRIQCPRPSVVSRC